MRNDEIVISDLVWESSQFPDIRDLYCDMPLCAYSIRAKNERIRAMCVSGNIVLGSIDLLDSIQEAKVWCNEHHKKAIRGHINA